MVSTQNLSFSFGCVSNGRVECPIGVAYLAMILLSSGFSLAILDNICTLAFRATIYNYLSYHVSMIPSVTHLPLPNDHLCPTSILQVVKVLWRSFVHVPAPDFS